jgi:hypothetical protein
MIRRTRDADAFVRDNIDKRIRIASKAVPRIGTEIRFMPPICNIERLREFARS